MKAVPRKAPAGIRQSLPWLVLGALLVLATMPTWRPLIFGVALSLDDLLNLRCLSW